MLLLISFPSSPISSAESWLSYLDAKIEARLKAPSPDISTAKMALDKDLEDFYNSTIAQVEEKKFRCTVTKCGKLFCASEFVKKHIRLKHPNLIANIRNKVSVARSDLTYLTVSTLALYQFINN